MSIHHSIIELELTHPFKISRRATDFFRQAITVEIDGGIGAASPTRFYGETIETVQHAFDSFTPIIDQAEDLDAIQSIMSEVDETLSGNYAAKSAIDLALHDRLAKRLGIPLFKLWGVDTNQALDTSFTIGLDEPEIMQQKVIQASDFPILKVKLGTDRDLEIIGAIREVTDKPIYVDANTAWSPKEAVCTKLNFEYGKVRGLDNLLLHNFRFIKSDGKRRVKRLVSINSPQFEERNTKSFC
jgi:L-alanine-DL-glutamate epimerase-like enolase superfamily enzyme